MLSRTYDSSSFCLTIKRRASPYFTSQRAAGGPPHTVREPLNTGLSTREKIVIGQVFESQVGVTCMQGQGICKDRSKICNELSTASIELMDVE